MDNAFHSIKQYITLRAVKQSLLTFICSIPPWVKNVLRQLVEENQQLMKKLGVVEVMVDKEIILKVCQVAMVMICNECFYFLKVELDTSTSISTLKDTMEPCKLNAG